MHIIQTHFLLTKPTENKSRFGVTNICILILESQLGLELILADLLVFFCCYFFFGVFFSRESLVLSVVYVTVIFRPNTGLQTLTYLIHGLQHQPRMSH